MRPHEIEYCFWEGYCGDLPSRAKEALQNRLFWERAALTMIAEDAVIHAKVTPEEVRRHQEEVAWLERELGALEQLEAETDSAWLWHQTGSYTRPVYQPVV